MASDTHPSEETVVSNSKPHNALCASNWGDRCNCDGPPCCTCGGLRYVQEFNPTDQDSGVSPCHECGDE